MQPGPIDDGTRRFADISNASWDRLKSICCNCFNRGFKKAHLVSITDFVNENRSEFADCKPWSTNFFLNHI